MKGNRVFGGRGTGVLAAMAVVFGVGIGAQAQTLDIQARADRLAAGFIASSNFCYSSTDRLIRDFQFWQNFSVIAAPPSTNGFFYAQRGQIKAFDSGAFPALFVSGLVTQLYREAVTVYPITVAEDPLTRDRVFYNANDQEIWRQAAPEGYDPFRFLRVVRPWALTNDSPDAVALRATYDPSRIRMQYLLIPVEGIPDYALYLATQAANQQTMTMAQTMMMDYSPDPSVFALTSITVSGGTADIGVHLPDGTNRHVDVFSSTSLTGFPWTLVTTTSPQSGLFHVQTLTTSSNCFYRAGNADIDTDGDGIPDDREQLLYGTEPLKWDTDGDGLSDYDELFTYFTNPLLRDSNANGMDDDEEILAAAAQRHDSATTKSIRYYYDADDRLIGAYGGNGPGGCAAAYANTPAGNTATALERSTP